MTNAKITGKILALILVLGHPFYG